jgi:polyisoprenoid-binding protein YceI
MSSTIALDQIPKGTYAVDPTHSNVGFEVRHMGIASVRGTFHKFEGSIDASGDALRLAGTVEAASIDTNEPNRDGHLQAPEFFDVQQHPQIKFHSTATEPAADGSIKLNGEITIKGITKPIELTGTLGEGGLDPWGNERVGFEVSGLIDRTEFDLKFNQTLPNGALLLANAVRLVVSVSAVKSS